jgi:pilus assembly protein CpaF
MVVHLTRLKGGARKITRISEMSRGKGRRDYRMRDLFIFRQSGVRDGQAVGSFHATGKVPFALERIQTAGIELPAELFKARELPLAA